MAETNRGAIYFCATRYFLYPKNIAIEHTINKDAMHYIFVLQLLFYNILDKITTEHKIGMHYAFAA